MRGKQAPKRNITPDAKYGNVTVAKLINTIMRKGKKTVAQSVVYGCFDIVEKKTNRSPVEVFEQAIRNVAPQVEVKGRRVGGANYQVPMEVRGSRRLALALRWLIEAAKTQKGLPMSQRLARELMEAAQNQGTAIKRKEEVYRMAKSNRAFAHFAR